MPTKYHWPLMPMTACASAPIAPKPRRPEPARTAPMTQQARQTGTQRNSRARSASTYSARRPSASARAMIAGPDMPQP